MPVTSHWSAWRAPLALSPRCHNCAVGSSNLLAQLHADRSLTRSIGMLVPWVLSAVTHPLPQKSGTWANGSVPRGRSVCTSHWGNSSILSLLSPSNPSGENCLFSCLSQNPLPIHFSGADRGVSQRLALFQMILRLFPKYIDFLGFAMFSNLHQWQYHRSTDSFPRRSNRLHNEYEASWSWVLGLLACPCSLLTLHWLQPILLILLCSDSC